MKRLIHSQWNTHTIDYTISVQRFFRKSEVKIRFDSFSKSVTFWRTGIILAFFHSVRNSPCFIQDWYIKSSGLQIDLPHSFNMWMLNLSWPWTLLGSRFWINVVVSSLVNVTGEIDLSVFFQILEGSSLELFIIKHCLAKKQLNNSAFFLKSVIFILIKGSRYTRNFFIV